MRSQSFQVLFPVTYLLFTVHTEQLHRIQLQRVNSTIECHRQSIWY